MTTLGIHRIAGALGAEVSGVDLAQDLDAETVAALRRAWLEHLVEVDGNAKLGSDTVLRIRPEKERAGPKFSGDGLPRVGHPDVGANRMVRQHRVVARG
jgi:hypothetical protein